VARKFFSVESCLGRLACAGFLAFALLVLAAPSGAADEYDSRSASSDSAVEESDSSATTDSGIWDDYDSQSAGHPLRIAAYVLHPVGVIVDRLIFRPAWWIGSHEPFHTLFGRTD
jgi:hypothetical protein